MIGEKVSLERRVAKASLVAVFNAVLWVLLPSLLGETLSRALPSTPLAIPSFVYAFGAAITALQTVAALTEGMAVSVPFTAGAYVTEAYYIWTATSGGNLALSVSGVSFVIAFAPLVYLMMVPPLFGALRAPITFLLEETEASRPAPDVI